MRKASGTITLDGRVFHDMTADGVRGLSPLTSHLIGHFHCDLHDAVTVARTKRSLQEGENTENEPADLPTAQSEGSVQTFYTTTTLSKGSVTWQLNIHNHA